MFNGCTSITSINLSSFDTSKVNFMFNMFSNCKNLTSLDLSSFDTSSVMRIEYMFYGCEKLEFVNFTNANLSDKLQKYDNMITGTSKNIAFCVNESNTPILNNLISNYSCSNIISDCSSDWRKYQQKLVPILNSCVDDCTSTLYPYEYLGKCYSQCQNVNNNNYLCYNCESDCKECNYNNLSYCKSCKDSNKFLDDGKCVSSCPYGYYIDNSNKICCPLQKCSNCTKESLSQNLCTVCFNGYYPIYYNVIYIIVEIYYFAIFPI